MVTSLIHGDEVGGREERVGSWTQGVGGWTMDQKALEKGRAEGCFVFMSWLIEVHFIF